MKSIVVHSKDKWLLARLCTELQMEGWEPELSWCNTFNPLNDDLGVRIRYMLLLNGGKILNKAIEFHNHWCDEWSPVKFTITEDNYKKILNTINNEYGTCN